jgi:hypothetical protein
MPNMPNDDGYEHRMRLMDERNRQRIVIENTLSSLVHSPSCFNVSLMDSCEGMSIQISQGDVSPTNADQYVMIDLDQSDLLIEYIRTASRAAKDLALLAEHYDDWIRE